MQEPGLSSKYLGVMWLGKISIYTTELQTQVLGILTQGQACELDVAS